MPLILPGNVASATASTGYDVANSCMFEDGGNDHLHRSISSGGSSTIWTASAWFKRSVLGQSASIYCSSESDNSHNFRCLFINADDRVQCAMYNGGYTFQVETNALLRDQSAFYHIMTAVDTTQSTAADRVKIWINGTLQTSFSTASYPSEDATFNFSTTDIYQLVSSLRRGSTIHNSGYIAELHILDGVVKSASDFGEFDEDSPTIWVPKDISGLTFGTSGFYLNFEDSADLGADASGNSNDFTATNIDATDQATDTPANNFATGNPLSNPRVVSSTVYLPTYSNGNNTINHANASYYTGDRSSIGVMSGKWYVEAECSAVGDELFIGLTSEENHSEIDTTYLYEDDGTFGGSAYGSAYVSGDIIQIAFDATNGTVWFGLNGTWQNSATAEEIQNGTTTNAAASGLTMTKFWHIASKGYNGATWNFNFGGCPAFTVSSGNADGDGYGNFEYAPPSGYYALCTKNLAEYG